MIRVCETCGQDAIFAWGIDAVGTAFLDRTPTPDGALVLVGDPAGEVTALWGVDPAGETMPWGTVIPAGAPRYREHECVEAEPHHLAHQTPPGVFDPHCPACRPGATG